MAQLASNTSWPQLALVKYATYHNFRKNSMLFLFFYENFLSKYVLVSMFLVTDFTSFDICKRVVLCAENVLMGKKSWKFYLSTACISIGNAISRNNRVILVYAIYIPWLLCWLNFKIYLVLRIHIKFIVFLLSWSMFYCYYKIEGNSINIEFYQIILTIFFTKSIKMIWSMRCMAKLLLVNMRWPCNS